MPIASRPISSPAISPLNTSCDVIHAATTGRSAAFAPEEHRAREVVALRELGRRTLEAHLTLLEEHRAVGDRQCDVERLLDDDDRHPFALEALDHPEQLLDQDRRE